VLGYVIRLLANRLAATHALGIGMEAHQSQAQGQHKRPDFHTVS
jgi:hypothetical protein